MVPYMRLRFLLPILVACALPAAAQNLVKWGEAGGWDVMVDPTVGNGCLITSKFEDGSTVRVGINPEDDDGYLMAFNEAWGAIVEGDTYAISFDLDGEEYEGDATGTWLAGTPGVEVSFDDSDFILDMVTKNTLILSHDGDEVMTIDLSGTPEGIEALIACQEAQSE